MRVLVGCECSGTVRDTFDARGHDAWSCDLKPSETPGKHIQCDVLEVLNEGWDIAIFHPMCTRLVSAGARHFKKSIMAQHDAIDFVLKLALAPIKRICIENPVGVLSTRWRKPDQIINPWEYGHGETKKTCLWLQRLPKLVPTDIVEGRNPACHEMFLTISNKVELARLRSLTYEGIANAMADQWGTLPIL